ncbi:MAG: primosomal protein N' [Phycisphaerales bacterium]
MSGLFGGHASDALSTTGARFVRVAIERGLDVQARSRTNPGGEGTLTYRTEDLLPVGRRVEVTLGRGNAPSAGIVVESGGGELAEGLDPGRIKPIVRDTGAGLPPTLVELARWMARYYVCPLGMVLATMMPAAVKKGTGRRTRVTFERTGIDAATIATLKPKARALAEALASLPAGSFPISPESLLEKLAVRTIAPVKRLEQLGLLRRIETEEVAERGGTADGTLGSAFDAAAEVRPDLTPQQSAIVEGIEAARRNFGVHLIRGVTGSGKTEVYLRLIERVVAEGRTALVLVPEISLTPQTAGRFTARFRAFGPGSVAVLHSGLTPSQRHKQWTLAGREGGARVVVGARSAVFAPLESLGIIVVDEEHAGDYKQDQLPRYHGRDVAIKRAQLEGCPVVLGSATPSLESWANSTHHRGKYRLWELTERVGGGRLPRVEVADLADERRALRLVHPRRDPWSDLVGPTLERAMHETFAAGGQALLLLNRRGYSAYIACPDTACGYRLTCDECDVMMVHHAWMPDGARPRREVVRCHHCHAQKLMPAVCPVCGRKLIRLGMGTQRLEEEIEAKFPEVSGAVLRADGDTMQSAKDWFAALSRFARKELRLLLGTQMIAKGLDFPNVRLVGVVNADSAMALADFRAGERTFQLVSQVAGRAGRGAEPGRVIVQTMDTNSPAIRYAAAHDYVGFADLELGFRRKAGLPPITRMARIVLRDRDIGKAQAAAKNLRSAIDRDVAAKSAPISVSGPMPAPIARIAGHHRLVIELVATSRAALQAVLAEVRCKGWLKSDAHTAVDIDPVSLL